MKSETTGKVTMAAFKNDKPLQLIPFPNGGWTIVQQDSAMMQPKDIGAYSCTDAMIEALNKMLPN